MNQRIEEIKKRLDAARPKFDFMTAVLGSGDNLCTAVAAESEEDGSMDFIADVYPRYVSSNHGSGSGKWLDIGIDTHLARIDFLKNIFTDVDYLLALLEDGDKQ